MLVALYLQTSKHTGRIVFANVRTCW